MVFKPYANGPVCRFNTKTGTELLKQRQEGVWVCSTNIESHDFFPGVTCQN